MTTWKLVPTEPISAMLSAMSCSKGRDAEGEFPMLLDMLDYSGENKTHTVLAAAYRAAIAASPEPPHISMTSEQAAGEPVAWEGGEGWESLAWQLCADENGEDACNELIWECGPIPEPWGDRWLKYEDEAKRIIALVRKHTTPPVQAAVEPVAYRYKFKEDLQWQYTTDKSQAHRLSVVESLYTTPPDHTVAMRAALDALLKAVDTSYSETCIALFIEIIAQLRAQLGEQG